MSWYGAEPKIDIRIWRPDRSKVGKGIVLSEEEAMYLKDILNGIL
ncbi:MAG: hypothetical protein IJM90_02580 [Firmicutes bacterium]|nr:hypothetical protein [Bacillota bacterium]